MFLIVQRSLHDPRGGLGYIIVIVLPDLFLYGLAPCTPQKYTDTRLILHTSDAANHDLKKVRTHTVDTGVLVPVMEAIFHRDVIGCTLGNCCDWKESSVVFLSQ